MNVEQKNNEIKRKKIFIHIVYYTNRILFPPAKVMFVLWTFYWAFLLTPDKETSFGQKIIIVIFGYFLMCGIADLIYASNKKRYLEYKTRITQKKMKRLRRITDQIQYESQYRKDEIVTENKGFTNFDYMEGHDFEYFCADVLKKNGFENVEVTQGSGDHGIDILAEKDNVSYAIQCKRYSSNVGNAAVQQAHTGKSIYKKDIAVVLTNRYFTAQAKEEAQALGVKLWDRDKLNSMIEKN